MIATIIIVGSLVIVSVLIHYEMLYQLSKAMPEKAARHRYRILAVVLGALCAHVMERVVRHLGTQLQQYAIGLRLLLFHDLFELGIDNSEPVGHVRFLVGLEAVTGLVLIAWTASFMLGQMQKFWGAK
jgi:hypothetical protein